MKNLKLKLHWQLVNNQIKKNLTVLKQLINLEFINSLCYLYEDTMKLPLNAKLSPELLWVAAQEQEQAFFRASANNKSTALKTVVNRADVNMVAGMTLSWVAGVGNTDYVITLPARSLVESALLVVNTAV